MIKKIVVRADDVGYTSVNDIGAFETFDHGVATAADVMLDTPGTVDALKRLRDYPWISVGWHTHFWGEPILDRYQVSSLLDSDTGHFRQDIWRTKEIDRNELAAEMRAQLERCIRILGKAPDTTDIRMGAGSVFGEVKAQVCREYGIVTGFEHHVKNSPDSLTWSPAKPEYEERLIFWMDPGPAYKDLFSDSVTELGKYDPVKYYTEDRGLSDRLPDNSIACQAWHPGYVDYYMCRQGDRGPKARNFLECRPLDVHALCSEELKNWIRENRIELMNFRDAIFGTHEFQEHLRETGSDLYVL